MGQGRERRFKQWNEARIRAVSASPDVSEPEGFSAHTFDISMGGAKILSPVSLALGSALRIGLKLARSGQTISVDAEVKWIRMNETEEMYEIGVMFKHDIPQTALSLMKNLYDESAGIPALISPDSGSGKSG